MLILDSARIQRYGTIHTLSLNIYFIVRLKDRNYKEERKTIKENDSEIKIKLTEDRIKKFHNPTLKEKNTAIKNL